MLPIGSLAVSVYVTCAPVLPLLPVDVQMLALRPTRVALPASPSNEAGPCFCMVPMQSSLERGSHHVVGSDRPESGEHHTLAVGHLFPEMRYSSR